MTLEIYYYIACIYNCSALVLDVSPRTSPNNPTIRAIRAVPGVKRKKAHCVMRWCVRLLEDSSRRRRTCGYIKDGTGWGKWKQLKNAVQLRVWTLVRSTFLPQREHTADRNTRVLLTVETATESTPGVQLAAAWRHTTQLEVWLGNWRAPHPPPFF